MHSPWGLLYQIVKETGWTWHQVLWKVSRTNMLMMMADRPNFISKKAAPEKKSGGDLAAQLLASGMAKKL